MRQAALASIPGVNAERGSDTAAAAVEAWNRSLERCRAGAAPEGGLDQAVAKVLPRGGVRAFGSRPRWLARELDALGLVRRPEPQGLVTGLAPFVGGDAVSLMRRGYYTKGDSDLF